MNSSDSLHITSLERLADRADRWSGFYRSNLDPCVQASADRFAGMAAGHRFRAAELAYDARGGMTEAQAERARLLRAPVASFTSPGGRAFTVGDGRHSGRWDGDSLWCDEWPVLLDGEQAGKLFRSLKYGTTADGQPRWHATIRQLYWDKAHDAPTGIGFDVAAFDTAEQALAAWGRSADQILDWFEGKPVMGSYGMVQRAPGSEAEQ
jgi:hypothetical protein